MKRNKNETSPSNSEARHLLFRNNYFSFSFLRKKPIQYYTFVAANSSFANPNFWICAFIFKEQYAKPLQIGFAEDGSWRKSWLESSLVERNHFLFLFRYLFPTYLLRLFIISLFLLDYFLIFAFERNAHFLFEFCHFKYFAALHLNL